MSTEEALWVARLTPMPSISIDVLLETNWGLDVWERRADAIVVAASEAQLSELERRRLARVEPTRRSLADHRPVASAGTAASAS